MPNITLYKADPITEDRNVPDLTIHIKITFPRLSSTGSDSLREHEAIYKAEAKRLTDALMGSLPGGTIHALLVELLRRKVDLYRGVYVYAGEIEDNETK